MYKRQAYTKVDRKGYESVVFTPKSFTTTDWVNTWSSGYEKTLDLTEGTRNVVYAMLDTSQKYNAFNYVIQQLEGSKISPWDRIVIGFFRPDIDYTWDGTSQTSIPVASQGGKTGLTQFYPPSFNELQQLISRINKITAPNRKFMEVYLSMGGWNFNCVPLFYTNSFASLPKKKDDVEKARKDLNGDQSYGNYCEPKNAMGAAPNKFNYTFFPDPAADDNPKTSFDPPTTNIKYVSSEPVFDPDVSAGGHGPGPTPAPGPGPKASDWTDLLNNDLYNGLAISLIPNNKQDRWPEWTLNVSGPIKIPQSPPLLNVDPNAMVGNEKYPGAAKMYYSFVKMASQVGANGVDLDYEEFWHADSFHTPNGATATSYNNGAPGLMPFTKAKLLRIALMLKYYCLKTKGGGKNTAGDSNNSEMGLSIPAPAVGAVGGAWYFGNLKGLFLDDAAFSYKTIFPLFTGHTPLDPSAVFNKLYNGGIFPMIYDLGAACYDCPEGDDDKCPLVEQVKYYTQTFANANINTYIGFEVGRPAYPQTNAKVGKQGGGDCDDTSLPPFKSDVKQILDSLYQKDNVKGAFYWEIFKGPGKYTSGDETCCFSNKCPTTDDAATGDSISQSMLSKWNSNGVQADSIVTVSDVCQYNMCGCKFDDCMQSSAMVCPKGGSLVSDNLSHVNLPEEPYHNGVNYPGPFDGKSNPVPYRQQLLRDYGCLLYTSPSPRD